VAGRGGRRSRPRTVGRHGRIPRAGTAVLGRGRARGGGVVVVAMSAVLIAGVLLGLSFACLVLPAFHALAGPDPEQGQISEGWRRRHEDGKGQR
jgi:hypothetical protein